ncbi:sigma factor-like helix-turn-helix DNA-binding protein [Streptomyces sp. NPDC001339]|uniref:sigma factor-like helix-turn-helix DNA-binding protein n=1 Tax=Streptomyces sp. NPDC001339 TaxID=3364563 RepID=UPI003679D5F3
MTRRATSDTHDAQASLAQDPKDARSLLRPLETHSIDDVNLPVRDAADRILTSQVVLDALDQLTARQREMIPLTYYRGHSVRQTYEHLGIPPGPVKSRTHNALRAPKDALGARCPAHP